MAKIAFLVYPKHFKNDKRGRKETHSFDGQSNIGAYMIKDALEREGISIKFCDPHTAKNYDIVLISLASSFDVYNLLKSIARLPFWQPGKRTFIVIIGGFGCQNVIPLRAYFDFAFFGRIEDVIAKDLQEIIQHGGCDREYVLAMTKGLYPIILHQSSLFYPYRLETHPPYQEFEIGCPHKCLFCHYTFARQSIQSSFNGNLNYAGSREIIFSDIINYFTVHQEYKTKTKTALDGYSERLRNAFNKRYSDGFIIETLERLSSMREKIWLQVYMIGSYPTETEEDRDSFLVMLKQIRPKNKLALTLHTFPFRAAPLTPSQYLSMDITTDWSTMNRQWCQETGWLYRSQNINVNWTAWQESPYTLLQSAIIERATEKTDSLIHTILFSSKFNNLKVSQKILALEWLFDLTPYLREYQTTEQIPTWYLESYIPNSRIQKMARKLKGRLGMPEKENCKCSS